MKILTPIILTISLFLGSANIKGQNAPAPIKMVQFVLTPDHSDWNYKPNEIATIKVSAFRFGIPLKDAEIQYQYGPEQMETYKKGIIKLKNGSADIQIGTMKTPGFLQFKVQTNVDHTSYRDEIKLGFNPFEIEPTVKMPSDFDDFWQKAMAENAKIPMDPILTYKPEYSTPEVAVYLVSLQNYKIGKHLYGYLSKPRDNKKHPVLFNPPGAGIKKIEPILSFAEKGFISFTTEIHGISPEVSQEDYNDLKFALDNYWFLRLDDKDNYYYKSVYLGCVRAIDFLTSLPEFDGQNVAVTGGSQGGALTIVTAALDKRVTSLAAFYPALCDLTGYLNGRAGGWPHTFSNKNLTINKGAEKISTASYYDVVNFAKKISIPGFYSGGYNDNTCPPTSLFSAFNSITAEKEIVITPISGHWRFEETNQQSLKWLQNKCQR